MPTARGADVNATTGGEMSPIHYADTLDILNALMDRGADPIVPHCEDKAPLMPQAAYGTVDVVARLLQDPSRPSHCQHAR